MLISMITMIRSGLTLAKRVVASQPGNMRIKKYGTSHREILNDACEVRELIDW